MDDVEKILVKSRGFDIDKMEKVTLGSEINFTPVETPSEALEAVNGDTSKYMAIFNAGLRRNLIAEAKKAPVANKFVVKEGKLTENHPSESVLGAAGAIMKFVAGFRLMPPWSLETDKKKQTAAIFAFIRSNEVLLNGLKALALASPDEEEEEEEEQE